MDFSDESSGPGGTSAGAGHSHPAQASDLVSRIEQSLMKLRRSRTLGRGRIGPELGHQGSETHHKHRGGQRHQEFGAKLRVLAELSKTAELSISEIAERVGVDQPRSSRLTQELESSHLIKKTPDPKDARRSLIAITESGKQLLQRIAEQRRQSTLVGLSGFTEEEQRLFAALLERFIKNTAEAAQHEHHRDHS